VLLHANERGASLWVGRLIFSVICHATSQDPVRRAHIWSEFPSQTQAGL
jgi:hypothetical protein